jgi:chromosome segregation ATPase
MEQPTAERFVIESEETLADINKNIKNIEAEIKMLDTTFQAEIEAVSKISHEARRLRKITLENQAEEIQTRINTLEKELRGYRRLILEINYAVEVKKLWHEIDGFLHAAGKDKSNVETTPEAKQNKIDEIKSKFEELKNSPGASGEAQTVLMRFEKLVTNL